MEEDRVGVRVLVWNVHGFRAGVGEIAGVISSANPDVVILNEARFRWRVRNLARRLGMDRATALGWPRPVTNAILARRPWRIVAARRVLLPKLRTRKRRGLLVVRLRAAGLPLTVAATHLGLSDPERVRHARLITDTLAGERGALVLAGDLNETPERPAARWIAERWWDAFAGAGEGEGWTFPSVSPRARIDYVFVSDGVRVRSARVVGGSDAVAASDHLPVVADLEV